jgi:hypothetical protein
MNTRLFEKAPKSMAASLCLGICFCIGAAHTAVAAAYHAATNGNDSNTGTQAQPWRTIQHAAKTMVAGDTVIVHGGTYDEDVSLVRSGSKGKRITFRASGKAVTKRFRVADFDYITIDGFEMTNSDDTGSFMRFSGDHIEILNNTIHDTRAMWGVILAEGDHVLIKDNRYYTSQPTDGSDRTVFTLSGTNGIVEGNEIGPAIDIDAFRMFGHNHVVRRNYVHNVTCSGSGAHVDVFQTFGVNGGESYDIVFENNVVVDFEGQLCMTENNQDPDFHDWDIRNNVFVNVPVQANLGIPNLRWYNNTFYNVGSGNRLVFSGSDNRPKGICNGLQIVNNIVIPADNVSTYGQVMGVNRNGLSGVIIDHNYVARMRGFGPLSGFNETHGVNGGDPRFVSAARNDFHLRSTSPAIDKGATLTGLNGDYDGTIRPQGAAWDIGAFEYVGRPDHESLKEGDVFNLGGRKATLKKLDTLPYVESEYTKRFEFDSYENPKLKELRERYKLEKVIAEGKDEFDQQVLLMDWTHRRFKKFGRPSANPKGALEILRDIEQGHSFFCTHYATVFVSAAASLGWVDRALALRRHQGVAEGGSTEHTSTEIWSNQYRKWIMLDPTSNMYLEKEGVPLNAFEIRQEWFYHEGSDLVFVIGKERQKYRKTDLPIFLAHFAGFGDLKVNPDELDKYGFIGYIPNTNLMDAGEDYANMFIVKDKLCEGTRWHERLVPSNPAVDPYFPVGQAALSLRTERERINVSLKTLTPNFKQYEIQTDAGGWEPSADNFLWSVHPGSNRLEVRTVNQLGINGHVSTAEMELSE